MKTKTLLYNLISAACLSFLVSCDKDNPGGREVTGHKEYVLTIASEQLPGILSDAEYSGLNYVYAVKRDQSDKWESYTPGIKGFEFEEGYECRVRISETSYLDRNMGQPAWTEYEMMELLSKEKKASEGLPGHLIPESYYSMDFFTPGYRFAVDAENKEIIEEDLRANPIMPASGHYFLMNGIFGWLILDNDGALVGNGVLGRNGKKLEDVPETYKILPFPDGLSLRGYGEYKFLDEAGKTSVYPDIDVFTCVVSETKDDVFFDVVVYLYKDLTDYYKTKYPEAGVKTVVVSYNVDLV